jgi:multidrug efflux pump subunit AcrA (membrane-fusion protein)
MPNLTHEQVAALDAMADNDAIARARDAFTDAVAKLDAAEQAEPAARAAVTKATAARAALVLQSTDGQHATPEATAAAARAVQDAEHHHAFIRDLATQLRAERQQREAELMQAQRTSYKPVAEYGARLRVAAAHRIVAAQTALAEARREHGSGTAALQHAEMRGFAPRPRTTGGPFAYLDAPDPFAERPAVAEIAYWRSAGLDVAEPDKTTAEAVRRVA